MEVMNFKTRFEIGQKIFMVWKDGSISTATITGVLFSHAPIKYICGDITTEDELLFPTFDEALAAAEPIWIDAQKKRCLPDYHDEL